MVYKENELYREIGIFMEGTKIGEAEVDLKNKMLSRLSIYEPYQDKGFGTLVVADLTEEYGLNNLWVNADNTKAIHVYEKCGYKIVHPTMYLMEKEENELNRVKNELEQEDCISRDMARKAITCLINFYNDAKNKPEIKKPISWSLYKTWEMVDGKEKPRNE